MSQWTQKEIDCQGTKIHYHRIGSGKQSLLLLHGITDDGSCWQLFAESLAAQYDIVMPDLRAHGKSDAPEQGYDLSTMAAEIKGVMDSLGLKKTILLGHSFGGIVVLTMAALYPELVHAIILEDSPPFWDWDFAPEIEAESRAHMAAWILSLKRKTYDELLFDTQKNIMPWQAVEVKNCINSKHRFDLKIIRMLAPKDILPPDFRGLLRTIACPALFIQGDIKKGGICPDDRLARLKELIPQMQTVHVPGVGHCVRRDKPDRYLEIIRDFIKKD